MALRRATARPLAAHLPPQAFTRIGSRATVCASSPFGIEILDNSMRRSPSTLPLRSMPRRPHSGFLLVLIAALSSAAIPAQAQRIVNYGADFLAGGVGGRALGMGGTRSEERRVGTER